MPNLILEFGVGLIAGSMNAIAGGGSFVSVPVLIALGTPSLNANATSTLALVPGALASGYAYRDGFRRFSNVSVAAMTATSIIGGALGARLLTHTPQRLFDAILPWLLLIGALTFVFGPQAGSWLRAKIHIEQGAFLLVCQFFLGVYGGYFGGAVGIMMLAAWSLLTTADLKAMQAMRNILGAAMNATASLAFALGGLIYWNTAAALGLGAIIGGYAAAFAANRLNPVRARQGASILIGLITIAFFCKTYF